jgi:non-ribosomal peptide synthetase component F
LALTIHHIAFDRWSRSVLKRELALLYSAFAADRPSPLAEPPLQYQDYAEWQRDRTAGKELEQSLGFWRDHLRGAPSALDLPRDHPQQTSPTYLGQKSEFPLSPELGEELARLSRSERASLFMTLLAAFNAFLWRVTGQTDLVVGVPIAGRTRLELSGLIGCFTNTLVLRTDMSGDPSFRELLGRVRRVALAGYAHQDLPFERLVRELQPERRLGKHPLFQVLFNYLDFPSEPLNPPGLDIEELDVPSKTALVDLSVDIRKSGHALACSFNCNAGLFGTTTVARLARAYLTALELFVSHPDSRISALPNSLRESESTDTDRLVQELEQMTNEEAERLLAAELRGQAR